MSILAEHVGRWRGSNAFRLTPTDPPYDADADVEVSPAVGGLVTEVSYRWSHPESGSQTGLLVVGASEEPPAVLAFWSDTFHQAPAATCLAGTSGPGTVTLDYTYAGDWRWTIVLDASDPTRLALRMDNTVPESAAPQGFPPGTYWAMKAELERSS